MEIIDILQVKMNNERMDKVWLAVVNFINWLEGYGELSWDHQSFFAGRVGGAAKGFYYRSHMLGAIAVSPMIFCEAFVPSARRIFWKKQRFPIADAHYAMGFALLARITHQNKYYQKAIHFLEELKKSRSPGFKLYCWGYPFNWVTRNGILPAHTPFITTLPYAYEAFDYVYSIDGDKNWLEIMRSIAEHAQQDIMDFRYGPDAFSCGYGPYDNEGGVVNASAYRAFLLTKAYNQFLDDRYRKSAQANLGFILNAQKEDGSWPYAVGDERAFVDHFHTCFVLKALAKIESIAHHQGCWAAIERGVEYYLENLIDENGLPKPFSIAPRMTVYRRELYDYAECINLCILLKDRILDLNRTLQIVIKDVLERWVKKDGSFRSRELFLGWDNVPMHRWAQSQMFRSLCMLLNNKMEREN